MRLRVPEHTPCSGEAERRGCPPASHCRQLPRAALSAHSPFSRPADTQREPLVAPGPCSRAAPPVTAKPPCGESAAPGGEAWGGGTALSPRSRLRALCTKDLLFPGFLNLLIICRNINTSCLQRGQKEEPTRALPRARKPEPFGIFRAPPPPSNRCGSVPPALLPTSVRKDGGRTNLLPRGSGGSGRGRTTSGQRPPPTGRSGVPEPAGGWGRSQPGGDR